MDRKPRNEEEEETPPWQPRTSKATKKMLAEYNQQKQGDVSAVDDSEEEDEEMMESQRAMTQSRIQRRQSIAEIRRKLIPFHWAPMLSPLTEADIDSCHLLEDAACKEPGEGATREQIEYRIRKSGSISFGLFNTYRPEDAKDWWIQTMRHCRPVETGRDDDSKWVMFAHIIATLGQQPVITDNDTKFPENWRDAAACGSSPLGHQFSGRTICLHSFAVCPEVQGVGIGKIAMKAYLQLMNESGVADRVALICKPSLIGFFSRVGFKHTGTSDVSIGGGGWHDMVCELPGPKKRTNERQGSMVGIKPGLSD